MPVVRNSDKIIIEPVVRKSDGVFHGWRLSYKVRDEVTGRLKTTQAEFIGSSIGEVCDEIGQFLAGLYRQMPYVVVKSQPKNAPSVSEREAYTIDGVYLGENPDG